MEIISLLSLLLKLQQSAWEIQMQELRRREEEENVITAKDFFVSDLQLGAIAHSYWKKGCQDLRECFRLAHNEMYGLTS